MDFEYIDLEYAHAVVDSIRDFMEQVQSPPIADKLTNQRLLTFMWETYTKPKPLLKVSTYEV